MPICYNELLIDTIYLFRLPVFVAGSHDSLIEDSYVHRYLAPIFQSIYSMDKKFTVRW